MCLTLVLCLGDTPLAPTATSLSLQSLARSLCARTHTDVAECGYKCSADDPSLPVIQGACYSIYIHIHTHTYTYRACDLPQQHTHTPTYTATYTHRNIHTSTALAISLSNKHIHTPTALAISLSTCSAIACEDRKHAGSDLSDDGNPPIGGGYSATCTVQADHEGAGITGAWKKGGNGKEAISVPEAAFLIFSSSPG